MTRLHPFAPLVAALFARGALAQTSARRPTIVIDPGHPSEVSDGATLHHGISEVHASWLVARRLESLLRARGYRVVLTKPAERRMVTNVERAAVANRERAALVVRLHCDASSDSGYAIYYPDRVGTAHGRTGPDTSVMRRSREAAESLHVALAARIGTRLEDGGVRGDSRTFVGGRQGALTGSIFSEVPVVLVEMVTLTNRGDAAFIRDAAGRRTIARAIAEGVARYVPITRSSRPHRDRLHNGLRRVGDVRER